ncbi:6-hydroxynicotinate 3-monooxygenase [Hypsizygus marmoreus]|uniref:6-hydroxynicotinate 3-monooxygenase n=1 Tax=Hypsizygus marmoreus TaxID=39966 RepID=A0A369K0U7_HYPMA|nr:6-hydroxynicotinate 3-monooxygenase [Hypsizygus marmoreus]
MFQSALVVATGETKGRNRRKVFIWRIKFCLVVFPPFLRTTLILPGSLSLGLSEMTFKKFKSAKQAILPIDFLIIGGGIAGLACATALRRVGHRVTVLEKDSALDRTPGPCRMPPNLSKILYHWGLQDEVRAIAIKSESISLLLYESGELLGKHHWDDEVMKETKGEFVFTHHSDLRKLLYDTATSYGAEVRLNTKVTCVDPDHGTVTLQTGEVLRADVIVGADGPDGLGRRTVLGREEEVEWGRLNMYSTTVPRKLIMEDPDLAYVYTQEYTTMFNWFGNDHSVLGFPIGDGSEFGLYVYGPNGHRGGTWDTTASVSDLEGILSTAEPRLRKLGALANKPTCVNVRTFPTLEQWVHAAGRMVLIGEAAHPLPPGSVQATAMTVEDGAVLAKLFSHLRTEDQISNFLWAFQDVRQPRCDSVVAREIGIVYFMTMPPGEHQEFRDQSMRAKRDAGIGILQASEDIEESPEWTEVKEVFGYDAEDEADNWWVEWGLLRERSKGVDVTYGTPLQKLGFPRYATRFRTTAST